MRFWPSNPKPDPTEAALRHLAVAVESLVLSLDRGHVGVRIWELETLVHRLGEIAAAIDRRPEGARIARFSLLGGEIIQEGRNDMAIQLPDDKSYRKKLVGIDKGGNEAAFPEGT